MPQKRRPQRHGHAGGETLIDSPEVLEAKIASARDERRGTWYRIELPRIFGDGLDDDDRYRAASRSVS